MLPSAYTARRATIEDLPGLHRIWNGPRPEEKRIGDLQVALDSQGIIVGVLGLQIASGHGTVHSETIVSTLDPDPIRALLWERISTVARNNGLFRLWSTLNTPFWSGVGFKEPTEDERKRLPAPLQVPNAAWTTLALRDEAAIAVSLDREFELFQQAQRAENEQILGQAKHFKAFAWAILIGFAAFVVVAVLWGLSKRFR